MILPLFIQELKGAKREERTVKRIFTRVRGLEIQIRTNSIKYKAFEIRESLTVFLQIQQGLYS